MATRKKTIDAEIPEVPAILETADQQIGIRRIIGPDGYARCGHCGVRLVNVEERIKCKFCWFCGRRVIWK